MLTASLVEEAVPLALALWFVLVKRGAADAILDGGPRGQHDVVLVHAHHVRALAAQDADDAKRDVVDADFLADRRHLGKQVPCHGVADDAYLVAVADVAVAEHLAFGHVPPIAHRRGTKAWCRRCCSGTQLWLP